MSASNRQSDTPELIRILLEWRGTDVLARIALTLPYWWSGLNKLFHPMAALAEFQATGLPPSWTIYGLLLLVQLGGSFAVIFNRRAWLGAGALAVFTLIVTYLAHAFWKLEGAQRMAEMNTFLEHIALMAGFAFAAMYLHKARSRRKPGGI
ncbi:DoxX family protein [Dyella psychrodurans]|uniref:DoxX family protein n=1 Tax=Dyella psychrodurans TaxID=1927960 RepID=A0A370X7C8_9GAMM|nr:DoxX family protein [Dyella psychrodurans]RDS84222.1 DoxX family protein [Dyella psychrodurans]